jgi:alpha-L-rhamnosidase
MRFSPLVPLFLGLFASFTTLHAEGIVAENLRCEHRVDPLGVDAKAPRLSWTLRATPGGQRGQKQTAYRILVASSEKILRENRGDLWDSGKTASDRCAEIDYGGKPLDSDRWCYWKAMVWDKNDLASNWSEPAHWSMGVLDRGEWRGKWLSHISPIEPKAEKKDAFAFQEANWIWTAEGDAVKSAPGGKRYFRVAFELPGDSPVESAEILVTADDHFTLFVNGIVSGRSRRGNDAWRDAQRREIADRLVAGRNCIAVEAENGDNSPAGVAAKLIIRLKNGETIQKISDASWVFSNAPENAWNEAKFDDSRWSKAQIAGKMGVAPWGQVAEGPASDSWMQPNFSPIFRKEFEVKKTLARATAHVCGLGYYELRLNGRKVGDRVLDPKFTRYDKRALYSTYEVTEQLAPGKNAIGVMLGTGFYNVHERDEWYFEKSPWRAEPTLLFQLKLEYTDGTSETIASDSTWKASTGPVVRDGIRNGEEYDARLERTGWDAVRFDDSAWAAPQIVEGPKGTLCAEISPIRVMQTLTPVAVTEPKPGVYVFDLGQNIAGWAQLKVSGPAGTQVVLRYSERLHTDGTVSLEPNDKFVYAGPFQTDRYTLSGRGEEVWEPRFAYHGFRYVEVTGFPGKPTADNLRGRVVHTAFEPAGSFECSNELLNKIQRNTLWAYRGHFVGIPTDCPHREKNGWTGDAQVVSEMAMFNFHNLPGYEAWMNDFHDEQRANGELPGIIPSSGWGYGIGPGWDSAYLIVPWNLYRYSGDVRVLADHYEDMKRLVDYFTSRSKDHIVEYGLSDWLPPKTQTPLAVITTAYYYTDAVLLSKIAKILGKNDDAAKYAELSEKIRTAFREKLCKPGGNVANNSQTALSCALYFDLAAPEERKAIFDNLVERVRQSDDHLDVGFAGSKYLFRVLADNGRADVALTMLEQTTPPGYGDWIARGATTLWEDWVGDESQNHVAFGDVSAWFYEYLAGIRLDPETPAFKTFTIRPMPAGDIVSAKATHESIYGPISVAWRRGEDGFSLELSVPVNTTATVYVPAADSATVTESGKPAAQSPGVKFLRMEGSSAVYRVESGDYSIKVVPKK